MKGSMSDVSKVCQHITLNKRQTRKFEGVIKRMWFITTFITPRRVQSSFGSVTKFIGGNLSGDEFRANCLFGKKKQKRKPISNKLS